MGLRFDGKIPAKDAAAMKTTIEIPDPLFRQAKVAAVKRGVTLKTLLVSALRNELGNVAGKSKTPARVLGALPGFGGLRHLRKETARINRVIDEEFGRIEPEDWK